MGEMAAENLHHATAGAGASYSEFSANPDASAPVALPQDMCFDCPDSYGVAVRMRAAREPRMSDAFRELGAIDTDTRRTAEAADAYHYGGRFPDSDSKTPEAAMATDRLAHDAADRPLQDSPPP